MSGRVSAILLPFKNRVVFCADATVNQGPNADVLEKVTCHTAELDRRFNVEPWVALLLYSNFESVDNEGTREPREAARRLREDPAVDFPSTVRCKLALPSLKKCPEDIRVLRAERPCERPHLSEPRGRQYWLQAPPGLGDTQARLGRCWPEWTNRCTSRGDEIEDIANLAAVADVDAQQE